MKIINKLTLFIFLTVPFVAYADKVPFTFINGTYNYVRLHIKQSDLCLRSSAYKKFVPESNNQFYTAEGSFCNPTGEWILNMYVEDNELYKKYDSKVKFKVKKQNGACTINFQPVTNSESAAFYHLEFTGNCVRK